MNKQIQQLALQSKLRPALLLHHWGKIDALTDSEQEELEQLEKFAELIVGECVEQLRYTVLNTQELRRDKSTDYQVGWEDGMFDAEEMIKEHFGVEE